MKAVIMAGGKGSRLRPLTCGKPKPMVSVFGKPVMEYAVELLKKYKITDIAVTLQYLPEVIREYFGNGSAKGVSMKYFDETTPLGTAGSVKNAEEFLDETFIVISGDGITDYDLSEAVEYHRTKGGMVTLVLARVEKPLEYGVVICDDDGRVVRFLEKPGWGEVFSDTVNTGIYIIEPDIFKYYDRNVFFDFSKDLFPVLLKEGIPMYGYVASGYWSDIGSLEQYRQTHNDIMDGRLKADIGGRMVDEDLWIGEGSVIEPGVTITERPVFIGENCRIESGVELGGYTVIGNNNTLCRGCSIKQSILWDYNYIEKGAELRGATVLSHTQIMSNSALFEGSVVGDSTLLGRGVMVKPQVKIWPHKIVEDNSVVTRSLVWGEGMRKNLFSNLGVAGTANVEISPEMVTKLAVAYGSNITQGEVVVVSGDHHRSSQVTKTACAAGLLAAGINIADIGIATTPITRYAVRTLKVRGGIHVRMLPGRDKIVLEFLDPEGINISRDMERKIENSYIQGDFRRAAVKNLGEIRYVPQMAEAYREGLLKTVDPDLVRRCRFRLLAAFDFKNLNWFIPPLFEKLGCQTMTVNSLDYSEQEVAGLVRDNRMDLGVILSSNADEITLLTPEGQSISGDNLLTLWAYISFNRLNKKELGVPVTAPSVIEALASQNGGRVVRTRNNPRALMKVFREEMFQPLFDGTFMLVRVLEYLQMADTGIKEVLEKVPRAHIYKTDVECPWFVKGSVMRRLIEDAREMKTELLDGIKIYLDAGWVLILPDSEEPVFKVVCEAKTMEEAQGLADRYTEKIEKYRVVV